MKIFYLLIFNLVVFSVTGFTISKKSDDPSTPVSVLPKQDTFQDTPLQLQQDGISGQLDQSPDGSQDQDGNPAAKQVINNCSQSVENFLTIFIYYCGTAFLILGVLLTFYQKRLITWLILPWDLFWVSL